MRKSLVNLQELRRKIYYKAKSEKTWSFWGLYVHVCKMETLKEAYKLAKRNDGAPGIDGMRFEDIESQGLEKFLQEIREQLIQGTYLPLRNRSRAIPKANGKFRMLGIPTIRDRVVQGALKLILEPIFEADFQDGSYGYRPKRQQAQAVERVAIAIIKGKTKVIDMDLKSYFDNVRHDILMTKMAERINDDQIMRLLKLILKANGKQGVPQGGVISPLLSNIYLNEVDKMLEKAKAVTTEGQLVRLEYARFADDLVIMISGHRNQDWIVKRVCKRLKEELDKIRVEINKEKTRIVDMEKEGKFTFLGFEFKRYRTENGKWNVRRKPKIEARTKLLKTMKQIFLKHRSQPVSRVIEQINPILRGWVNYFRVGNSGRTFKYIQNWVIEKIRRHLRRARKQQGFGWNVWSNEWLYKHLNLYNDYKVKWLPKKAIPEQ